MKNIVFFILFLGCLVPALNSQEIVQAEKEILKRISLGTKSGQVSYQSNEEGFFSPNGPIVTADSSLFFYPTTSHDKFIKYSRNTLSELPLFSGWPSFTSTGYVFTSQGGMVNLTRTIPVYKFHEDSVAYFDWGKVRTPKAGDGKIYFLPTCSILESPADGNLFSMEYKEKTFIIRDLQETVNWLPTQPGGFSIGTDGLLYKNGMLWSAVRPNASEKPVGNYVGKLGSGHNFWSTREPGNSQESLFTVTNSAGKTELEISFPWAQEQNNNKEKRLYNFGVGPWGEIYVLLAPPLIISENPTRPSRPKVDFDTTKPAELVVVRNHLKYFGRLNDSDVRLRKEASTSGEILGAYPAKTGFRILEKGTKEETIAGQKNVWYKVRLLDGKEGWFFGAFVHNLYDGPNGLPPPWPNVPDW